jgi:hypothetical protein
MKTLAIGFEWIIAMDLRSSPVKSSKKIRIVQHRWANYTLGSQPKGDGRLYNGRYGGESRSRCSGRSAMTEGIVGRCSDERHRIWSKAVRWVGMNSGLVIPGKRITNEIVCVDPMKVSESSLARLENTPKFGDALI